MEDEEINLPFVNLQKSNFLLLNENQNSDIRMDQKDGSRIMNIRFEEGK